MKQTNGPRDFLRKLVPASLAARCLWAVILGAVVGIAWGDGADSLQPLADLFVRLSTLVVLPFMVVEVITCLGDLNPAGRSMLLRQGGWIILGLLALAVGMVCLLPWMLPPLLSSPLFDPQILEKPARVGVLSFLIPENFFAALASGNFAAAAFCSAVIGLALQKMPARESVLALLRPVRALSLGLVTWVAEKVSPFGIFAMTATTLGHRETVQLERLLGFVALVAVGLLITGLFFLPGTVVGSTRVTWRHWWRACQAPLVLVACTGQVFLSLPLVLTSLQEEIWNRMPGRNRAEDFDAVKAFVILGFSLFSFGKWALLVFVPFAAWYYDAPLHAAETLRMLVTAIPASVGGVYLAIVQELPRLGLPAALGNLYLLNYAWAARCGDVLTLLATLAGAVLLCAWGRGGVQVRPGRLALFLGGGVLAGVLAGGAAHRLLSEALKDSQGTREIVMRRGSIVEGPEPVRRTTPPEPAPPTLAGIQARGVLRAGLLLGSAPWVYQNGRGELVGYDVDLLKALAQSLRLRLEVVAGEGNQLRRWLDEERIDCALGGVPGSSILGWEKLQHTGYEMTCLALVVDDRKLAEVQDRMESETDAPLKLGRAEAISLSPELERAVKAQLPTRAGGSQVALLTRDSKESIGEVNLRSDAILTTAEGGSAYAVLHPQYSMVPAFGKRMTMEVGFVTETKDQAFLLFLENWVETNRNLGLFLRLRRHWLEFR